MSKRKNITIVSSRMLLGRPSLPQCVALLVLLGIPLVQQQLLLYRLTTTTTTREHPDTARVLPNNNNRSRLQDTPLSATTMTVPSSSSSSTLPMQTTKTRIFVISLQHVPGAAPENQGRLDAFQRDWMTMCAIRNATTTTRTSTQTTTRTEFTFHHCPGVLHGKRGYGLTQSFVQCLGWASRLATNDTSSFGSSGTRFGKDLSETMTLFFEDDARLYNSDFCHAPFRTNLWKSVPDDALVVLLGGHGWKTPRLLPTNNQTTSNAASTTSRIQETTFSYGTYGFAVPQRSLLELRDGYALDLANKSAKFLRPDVSWYQHAMHHNKRMYKTEPLVVWHQEGFSNTWGGWRGAIQEDGPETSNVYSALTVGQDVVVKKERNGALGTGHVVRVHPNQTVDIEFGSGRVALAVPRGSVQARKVASNLSQLTVGDRVYAPPVQGGPISYPGAITFVYKGDECYVAFDSDPNAEWLVWRKEISDQPGVFSKLAVGQHVLVYEADMDDYRAGTVVGLHPDRGTYDISLDDHGTGSVHYGIARRQILVPAETRSKLKAGQRVLARWNVEYQPGNVSECTYNVERYDIDFQKGPYTARTDVPRDEIVRREAS